jgi:hypothetical protein
MNTVNMPGFTAEGSLYSTRVHYFERGTLVQGGATVQPAQIGILDPCLLGPNINVAWQSFHDGRRGVVVVTGSNFAGRTPVRVQFDNCSSAFPELGSTTSNTCGQFTILHTCTCGGPPITVTARDSSGNSANGTVRQNC